MENINGGIPCSDERVQNQECNQQGCPGIYPETIGIRTPFFI